jgi:hypothetical protein
LNTVFTVEEYKYFLTNPCPEIGESSTVEVREAEKIWKKADKMARCYMLASMSNILQSKYENKPTAYNIDCSLREMFADKSRLARQEALKSIMNTKIPEGT